MTAPLVPPSSRADQLKLLLAESKTFDRPELVIRIDGLIETMARHQERYLTKNAVLAVFRTTLKPCRNLGNDDKQRMCDWLERILEIHGMESSDGLLDAWLHGISI